MRRMRLTDFLSQAGLVSLAVFVAASGCLAIEPAWAGLQSSSGTLAACAGSDPSGANAKLILTGTVEKVVVRPDASEVRVRVDRVYKGEIGGTVEVLTRSGSRSGNSEDVSFVEGDRYLLYLQRPGEVWTTDVCLGTREIGDTLPPELVPVLGEGVPPGAPATIPETGGVELPLVALVGSALLGAGMVLWRRTR